MTRYTRFDTPLGAVLATETNGFLTSVNFAGAKYLPGIEPGWIEDALSPVLVACRQQLLEYFEGERGRFDLPMAPPGTPFQKRVWQEIAAVPFGHTITYAELATRAGAPGSARAAGAATGKNPLAVIVPCHRIVGANGSLTGYAGGLDRKHELLRFEGALEAVDA